MTHAQKLTVSSLRDGDRRPRSATMASERRHESDAPLPLSELVDRLSVETFEWLQSIENAQEKEANETPSSAMLFANDDDDEEVYVRVQEWISSTSNPDGTGGYQNEDADAVAPIDDDDSSLRVKYILSDAAGGHGDDLWAASRHVSNLFCNPNTCRELLKSTREHPLLGVPLLELGAGAGLPSWTAMWCGARVVCTDQPIANRIRCMCESAERNYRNMVSQLSSDDPRLAHAKEARVYPYNWGDSNISELLLTGESKDSQFDVIVAADCIYMPECHSILLDSIKLLLSQDGVALLPFALHGNTDDEKVWAIVELARAKGFQVETLESRQLTPQAGSMDSKRGLVNMLRLTIWK